MNQFQNETYIAKIPDGTILVKKANFEQFSYRLQVNDQKFPFYHRSNGITRTEVWNYNQNSYFPVINVINGILSMADLFNRAYMETIFNDTFVASGVQIMPLSSSDGENVQRIINVAGATFYPLAVSLLMPLFMYTIVLEKEVKYNIIISVKTNRNHEDQRTENALLLDMQLYL